MKTFSTYVVVSTVHDVSGYDSVAVMVVNIQNSGIKDSSHSLLPVYVEIMLQKPPQYPQTWLQ